MLGPKIRSREVPWTLHSLSLSGYVVSNDSTKARNVALGSTCHPFIGTSPSSPPSLTLPASNLSSTHLCHEYHLNESLGTLPFVIVCTQHSAFETHPSRINNPALFLDEQYSREAAPCVCSLGEGHPRCFQFRLLQRRCHGQSCTDFRVDQDGFHQQSSVV